MVVVAYGNILPQSILDLPRFLPINIHGSLLPRHRGASPIQTALLEGDTETGITIMKMVREMDAGDILSTYTIPLSPDETSGSLFEKFAVHSGPVVLEAIRSYAKGSICLLPQNHADATFTKKLEKSDGEMIWAGYSSKQLYHRWQACTPWP
jgi:methionyl-tRNA formyltransferase